MPVDNSTRTAPIRLDYSNDRVVVVTTEADRFVTSCADAAHACKAWDRQREFQEQFSGRLLPLLGKWVKEHADWIDRGFLTVREDGLLFVVVQKSPAHTRALEDELTALDMQIAQDETLDLVDLEVLALPEASEETLTAFLDSRSTLEYDA